MKFKFYEVWNKPNTETRECLPMFDEVIEIDDYIVQKGNFFTFRSAKYKVVEINTILKRENNKITIDFIGVYLEEV